MKAEYTDVWFEKGVEVAGSQKTVHLPFSRISARALVVRKHDGALLGALHQEGGRYALPGGAMDDGESSAETVARELAEENIHLAGADDGWDLRVAVDYFDGYRELSIWHIIEVDDAIIGKCEENIDCRWIQQDEDVWHPFMRERLLLILNQSLPELVKSRLVVQ